MNARKAVVGQHLVNLEALFQQYTHPFSPQAWWWCLGWINQMLFLIFINWSSLRWIKSRIESLSDRTITKLFGVSMSPSVDNISVRRGGTRQPQCRFQMQWHIQVKTCNCRFRPENLTGAKIYHGWCESQSHVIQCLWLVKWTHLWKTELLPRLFNSYSVVCVIHEAVKPCFAPPGILWSLPLLVPCYKALVVFWANKN
jgi:hypothetical protein